MRSLQHWVLACASGAALVAAGVFACKSDPAADPPGRADDGTPDAGTNAPATPGTPGTPAADAGPNLPQAKGDPCRGVPLPVDQHYAPKGVCARVVAAGMAKLRELSFAPNGDLFGVSTDGSIWRLHDADGDGFFQPAEIAKWAATGGNGNNCHVDAEGGFVYAGSTDGVKRFAYDPSAASGGPGEDVVVGQPSDGHAFHTVHVYDGHLYVHSGSAGNATNPNSPEYDDDRSLIRRFALSAFTPGTAMQWKSGEVVTVGLRNANGFTRNAAGRMYAVVNGLDEQKYGGTDVHNDNPGEQIVEIAMGRRYGYPFCFTAQRVVSGAAVVAPGTQLYNEGFGVHDDAWCAANSMKPATFVQAHSAPLDITFFDSQPQGALPERWRGGAFVAMHGSWDRSPPTGYKVVWIPFDAQGNAPMPTSTADATTFPYEIVFGGGDASGPKDGPWSWQANLYSDAPRPVGVAISPIDGALYVSTDSGGIVYRLGVAK